MKCKTMRRAIVLAASVAALVVLAKTTDATSYVGTLWRQARQVAKDQVPTKFEIERIRHEIAGLDGDVGRMIRPIAEHKVAVERLRQDVADDTARLAEQRKVLLDAIAAVKSGKRELVYGGRPYSVDHVKAKIALDSEAFKRLEASVAAKKKLLESKEETLRAAQEQLQSFMGKKQQFEVQLAQFEAEHEINQVAAVGTDIKVDGTRAATIAAALKELKDKIDQQRVELEYRKGVIEVSGIPLSQPQQPAAVDLESIQQHLEGTAQKTTSKAAGRK